MNRQLISHTVAGRLNQVRERGMALDPEQFGEGGFFVTSAKEVLRDTPEAEARLSSFTAANHWGAADTDCLTSLRLVALHGAKEMPPAIYPANEQFLKQLKARIDAREPLFDLLADRYAWPLNFSFEADEAIREVMLTKLMTADRKRVENSSAAAVDLDELMLKLNLIAVHSCATNDLRFLDALNYYYELLPREWQPRTEHGWLLATYFALYARALAAWI